jgi:hypothetical protein
MFSNYNPANRICQQNFKTKPNFDRWPQKLWVLKQKP